MKVDPSLYSVINVSDELRTKGECVVFRTNFVHCIKEFSHWKVTTNRDRLATFWHPYFGISILRIVYTLTTLKRQYPIKSKYALIILCSRRNCKKRLHMAKMDSSKSPLHIKTHLKNYVVLFTPCGIPNIYYDQTLYISFNNCLHFPY